MNRVLSYEKRDNLIHNLCGVTKLVFFLLWSVTAMMTYDTRILIIMPVTGFLILRASGTRWRQVSTVFSFILIFLIINLLAIFFFSPYQGTLIYGTRHNLFHVAGDCWVTSEQLFYEFNVMLKYFTIIPSVFMFIVATNPSELAASLNRIGVSYKMGYSIAIALRYIPDVQDDFRKIKYAQEARGIEMSSKAGLFNRIKKTSAIIFPLVFTSMERIDTVSNAMELRCFGRKKKRTWYMGRPLKRADYAVLVLITVFSVAALAVTYADGNRFYNPFV